MQQGWIKIHRCLWENPIVTKDSDHVAVWLWLLTNAAHKERAALFGGKKIKLMPGQLITGRNKIAQATQIEESKVKRILKLFKSDQQIDQRVTNQGSLITILNWDKYQICDQQNDQRVTNERPTDDQRMTTKQELNNINNINNNIYKQQLQQSTYIDRGGGKKYLSDFLSDDDWKKLQRNYDQAVKLIDQVDELVSEPEKIREPFRYIVGYAKNKKWPLKAEARVGE